MSDVNFNNRIERSAPVADTSVLYGCEISGIGSATLSIDAGVYHIVDHSAYPPVVTTVQYAGQTGVTPLYTQGYVMLNSSGSVIQIDGTVASPTPLQIRDNCLLGQYAFIGGLIVVIANAPDVNYGMSHRFADLCNAIGVFNAEGNIVTPNGANLKLNKSAGRTFNFGGNFSTSRKVQDITLDPIATPIPGAPNLISYQSSPGNFTYVDWTGGDVTPDLFDTGTGPGTVSNNKWTIQRLYYFNITNTYVIYLGQFEYANKEDAIAAVDRELRTIDPATKPASHIASIVIKKGATNLSDTEQALIFTPPKIKGGTSGGQSIQSARSHLSDTVSITASSYQNNLLINKTGIDKIEQNGINMMPPFPAFTPATGELALSVTAGDFLFIAFH